MGFSHVVLWVLMNFVSQSGWWTGLGWLLVVNFFRVGDLRVLAMVAGGGGLMSFLDFFFFGMEIWVVDVWVSAVVTSGGGLWKFGLLVMQIFCIELEIFKKIKLGK